MLQNRISSRELKPLPHALTVRDAWKTYDGSNKKSHVLKNFCMTVSQGSIYALLGASGCGKTTLLTCIVALQNLDYGKIRIFGYKPGSKDSGVPGSRLGFMPQEISLCPECSIEEIVIYFGMVHGMTEDDIELRMTFLIKLMQLPHKQRLIHTLSGGQQRRVSFAVALLHQPEILILDEPTVGLDPLFRQGIWSYLRQLASVNKTTIILTTHYMEEARHAQVVGMMRNGRLLAEDSPTYLMRMYHSQTLEGVFLNLCLEDEQQGADAHYPSDDNNEDSRRMSECRSTAKIHVHDVPASSRIRATIYRDVIMLKRNILSSMVIYAQPLFMMVLYCMYVGGDPKGLSFAVVNNEWPTDPICQYKGNCKFQNLSCVFMKNLDSDVVNLVPYDIEAKAVEAVRRGDAWGLISFPANFSKMVEDRFFNNSLYSTKNRVNASYSAKLSMDMINVPIGLQIQHIMTSTSMVSPSCDKFNRLLTSPIKFGKPIYGSEDPTFLEFMSPGVLIFTIFGASFAGIACKLILDNNSGTPQRAMISGLSSWHKFCGTLVINVIVLLVQVTSSVGVMCLFTGVTPTLNWVWLFCIAIMQGICGYTLGFYVSQTSADYGTFVVLMYAVALPNILLSGIYWPLECTPSTWFQWLCFGGIHTLAYEASRSIIGRGWGFLHPKVWPGFAATTIWTLIFALGIFLNPRMGKIRVSARKIFSK